MKKLSEELVDKQIIVERSRKYGNNFPLVAQLWKNYLKQRFDLDVAITSSDAAFMFSLHKISRLANNPGDQDTLKDMINYAWLGIDYDQYLSLLEKSNKDNKIVQKMLQKFNREFNQEICNLKEQIDDQQYSKNEYDDMEEYNQQEYFDECEKGCERKEEERYLNEQNQEKYCYWYKRPCVYEQQGIGWEEDQCPMGYDNWEDCDFNTPTEIN